MRNRRNKMMMKKAATTKIKAAAWEKGGMQRVYINGFFSFQDKFFAERGADGSVSYQLRMASGRPGTAEEMMAGDAIGDLISKVGTADDWSTFFSAIKERGQIFF